MFKQCFFGAFKAVAQAQRHGGQVETSQKCKLNNWKVLLLDKNGNFISWINPELLYSLSSWISFKIAHFSFQRILKTRMWHHVVTEAEPWSDSKLVQLWVKKSGVNS